MWREHCIVRIGLLCLHERELSHDLVPLGLFWMRSPMVYCINSDRSVGRALGWNSKVSGFKSRLTFLN